RLPLQSILARNAIKKKVCLRLTRKHGVFIGCALFLHQRKKHSSCLAMCFHTGAKKVTVFVTLLALVPRQQVRQTRATRLPKPNNLIKIFAKTIVQLLTISD